MEWMHQFGIGFELMVSVLAVVDYCTDESWHNATTLLNRFPHTGSQKTIKATLH